MPGKHLSNEVRTLIINDHANGLSFRTIGSIFFRRKFIDFISEKYGISHTTAVGLVKKVKESGSVKSKPKSGRPKLTSPRSERYIVRRIVENPRLTSSDLKNEISNVLKKHC